MKIDGPSKTQKSSETKKKSKVSGDGSFGNMVSGGAKESSGAGATQSIAQLESLLAVQSAEDPTEKANRKKMQLRAGDILDQLDRVRMALLTGNITIGHVIDIADVVASHREKITDPELTALLDEIDLRAQVEIAKMRVSINSL
jgi:hypothetical protein